MAEIERENINVQFNAGRIQKLMNGGWPGGPIPFGYISVDKELQISSDEAEIVKLIYNKYIEKDASANGLAIWLNDNGYKRTVKDAEKPFTYDFIKTVLDNPIYMGKIFYNRRTNIKRVKRNPKNQIVVDGIHEAIIVPELWEQVRQKRESLSSVPEKVDNPDRSSLLSGIIKCPMCGNGMIATKNKSINKNKGGYYKTIHYYSCKYYRKSAGRTCGFKHTYNQDKIDSSIFEIVSNLSLNDNFNETIDVACGGNDSVEAYEKTISEIRKEIHHQEHEKNRLGAELDNLNIMSDDYDVEYERVQVLIDETYDIIEELESKLKKIKKKLTGVQNGIKSVESVKAVISSFGEFFDKMTCEEQRELYRHFIESIEVYPEEQKDGRIFKSITFRFPIYYGDTSTLEYCTNTNEKADEEVKFVLDCNLLKPTVAESKATYAEIRAWVLNNRGLKVSSLYIAQIKRKYGIDVGEAFNKTSDSNKHVPKCPKEKEIAIIDALKAYRMLADDVEYKEEAAG